MQSIDIKNITLDQAYEYYSKGFEIKCDGDRNFYTIVPNEVISNTIDSICNLFADLCDAIVKVVKPIIGAITKIFLKYIKNLKKYRKYLKKFYMNNKKYIKIKKGKKYIYFLHKIKV